MPDTAPAFDGVALPFWFPSDELAPYIFFAGPPLTMSEARDLAATDTAAAAATTGDLVVRGAPDAWKLLWKVSSKAAGGMFSIKNNAGSGLYQFSWKLGAEVCEALVASPGNMRPVQPGVNYRFIVADDLVHSNAEDYHTVESAVESARGGFRKCTLRFYTRSTTGWCDWVYLVLTEERGKIAMAATVVHIA